MINIKYLIIGTGGTGCAIGGFLALNNEDVGFISRGKNLEIMKKSGLKIKSGIKGDIHIPKVNVFSSEEYKEKADVIFVCVKSYSIGEITDVINEVAHKDTVIIPIMNGYAMGEKLAKEVSTGHVLDGCIYISAFIDSPGSIVQLGNLFRIAFGVREGMSVKLDTLEEIKNALEKAGIEVIISQNIKMDTFKKFSFISSYAACGAYYDITAKEMQEEGKARKTFIALCEEIKQIAVKLGIDLDIDITEANLKILDSLTPDTTASTQKDMKAGRKTEIDGLVFEMIRMANDLGIDVPIYSMIGKQFGYKIG